MYQRDYILRLIQQMTKAIGETVFLRKNRQFEQAMEVLGQAMKQLLGLNSKLIEGLSARELLKLLSPGGGPEPGKALALGQALDAEANVLEEMGKSREAEARRMKALEILLIVRTSGDAQELLEAFDEEIDKLMARINTGDVEPDARRLLIPYYEAKGRYAKAEDELFRLLEGDALSPNGRKESLLEEGIRMYERWSTLSEEELRLGNFSAEEVDESLALLRRWRGE